MTDQRLHETRIVTRRKNRTQIFYRVVDEGVFELCEPGRGSVQRQVLGWNAILEGVGR